MSIDELISQSLKLEVKDFKEISGTHKYYSKENLRNVYNHLSIINSVNQINFFLSKGYIFLVPESGDGFEKDLTVMLKVMSRIS